MSHQVKFVPGKEELFFHDAELAVTEIRADVDALETAVGDLETAVAYTPTAGLFESPAPTTIAQALNRMAALLKTLNSDTEIP